MADYVWHGISGQEVHYYNPAAWTVNGAAAAKPPGPGDTVVLAFPGPNSVPVFVAPGARKGDVVSGQTLDFGVSGTTRLRVAKFNGTILDPSTTANFTGLGQVEVQGSTGWNGVVNVGTPAGAADLQLLLAGSVRLFGKVPELVNAGTVNVAHASKLHLAAQTGGGMVTTPDFQVVDFMPSQFEFHNDGTLDVSGGSTLLYSSPGATSGLYSNAFINHGTLRIRGGGDRTNTARLDAHLRGPGTIVMDGGDAPKNEQTLLITTGNVADQTVVLRNAWWTAADPAGHARVGTYDARGNFMSGWVSVALQGGRNTIFLEPSHRRASKVPTPDIDSPFGATVHGFTAGDTLIVREPYRPDVRLSWDQSRQTLTVIQPPYDAGGGQIQPQVELAQFYLEGEYAESDFVVKGEKATKAYPHDLVRVTTTNTRNAGATPLPTVVFAPDQTALQDAPGSQRYRGHAGREALVVAEGARGSRIEARPGGVVAFVHAGQTDILRDVAEVRFIDGRLVFDADHPAAQVARLHRAAFGRAPDSEGLSHWAGRRASGASPTDLAQSFLDGADPARSGTDATDVQFLNVVHRNLFGRDANATELPHWTGRLSRGAGRASVLVGIAESAYGKQVTADLVSGGLWVPDPAAAQVARLYNVAFGRLPDAGGLAHWTGRLGAGGIGLQDVAARLVSDAGFQARHGALSDRDFVAALYVDALGRAPGGDELAQWTTRLGAGATRASVVVGLSESAEYRRLTAASILGDGPGQWGIAMP